MVRIDLLKQLDRVRFIFSPIMSCLLRKFLASGLACHGSAAAEAAESEPSHAACSGGVGGWCWCSRRRLLRQYKIRESSIRLSAGTRSGKSKALAKKGAKRRLKPFNRVLHELTALAGVSFRDGKSSELGSALVAARTSD